MAGEHLCLNVRDICLLLRSPYIRHTALVVCRNAIVGANPMAVNRSVVSEQFIFPTKQSLELVRSAVIQDNSRPTLQAAAASIRYTRPRRPMRLPFRH